MNKLVELKQQIKHTQSQLQALKAQYAKLKKRDIKEDVSEYLAEIEQSEEIAACDIAGVFQISTNKAARILKSLGFVCNIIKVEGRSAKVYRRLQDV